MDYAGGHGLVAFAMLLLDDSSPHAVVVDKRRPASFGRLEEALCAVWPRLRGRVLYAEMRIEDFEVPEEAMLVGVHACGPLTDRILDRAIDGAARVAVMPCCHSVERCDLGSLEGWLPPALAVDATRAARMRSAGFLVRTATIPEDITPENRLLLAKPRP